MKESAPNSPCFSLAGLYNYSFLILDFHVGVSQADTNVAAVSG